MGPSRRHLAAILDWAGVSRAVLAARARALFPRRWLTALTYHRVGNDVAPGFDPEVLDASPAVFEEHVKLLKRYFTLIDTRDLDTWRAGGPLPPNPAMITFDDGYRDNHDIVMPILRRHDAKAVFFIATESIGERRVFWWELVNHAIQKATRDRASVRYPRAIALPLASESERRTSVRTVLKLLKQEAGVDMERFIAELHEACGLRFDREEEKRLAEAMLMSWDHIRGLRDGGLDVQSHSHAHRVLHTLTPAEATRDLRRAREELEGALDQPVRALAYPTGRPIADVPALRTAVLEAGYQYGFTVERLVPLARMDDWLRIPRMMIDRAVSESFYRSTLAVPSLAY